MEKIQEKIIEIINQYTEEITVTNVDELLSEIGINSVKFIKIIIDIEDEFDFEFEDEELNLNNLDTVAKISEYVERFIKDA